MMRHLNMKQRGDLERLEDTKCRRGAQAKAETNVVLAGNLADFHCQLRVCKEHEDREAHENTP